MKIAPLTPERFYSAASTVAKTVTEAASLVGLGDRVGSAFRGARRQLGDGALGGGFLGMLGGPIGILLGVTYGATVGAISGAVSGFVSPKAH
jgi:hypothetical protein